MSVVATSSEPRYKVTSLERGLAVLRAMRDADGPLRNHDVVSRTGLPKATVSRLMSTLSTLGYLRRTDQGSYVLRDQSARPGRAMLEGLRLERHAPALKSVLSATGGAAYLEAQIGAARVAVFRWLHDGCTLLSAGYGESTELAACESVDLGSVGEFVLTFRVPPGVELTDAQLDRAKAALLKVSGALRSDASA
ncbi:helix-turn-helix domain-containing protein [Ramlibacter sp.]|uniref:helix-turn-helix domain-containing protein n=1 Tax=Ramlibacter sp. TaxID=1917967 RepID=UPI003D0D4969